MKEILFPDVYPLYGQVDIKGSSETRNAGVRKDLTKQITELISLLKKLDLKKLVGPIHREELQLNIFLDELSSPLKADTEQYISNYLVNRIHVRLQGISDPTVLPVINKYLAETDKGKGSFHIHRRKYETTISIINEKMSSVIDSRQSAAQVLFPHYYERYKTDGVEHNLYIGPSISPGHEFNVEKLHWLRLWQLRVLCEMETVHHHLKPALPYPLEVTTLVLVYNSTIAIRFRMDEKRFDVDGSYNARFEIVKKRIDKAHIKNTPDRITQSGKLTIVYSSDVEECEYRRYIETLQSERLLGNEIEQFEVEELKGISGLKGLRVKIVHQEVLA